MFNVATCLSPLTSIYRHRRDNIADNVDNELAPQDILGRILNRGYPIITVVADKSLADEEAAEIVQILNRAAAELGRYDIISELGHVRELAAGPLADVPEVKPVLVRKVCHLTSQPLVRMAEDKPCRNRNQRTR